jgi:DNA mismatch repair protein MutL
MGKIKTLREDVYKKIAAGEVVERPLSVVKELVENSIDAGADTVEIEIIEGGKRFIKVTDNGTGFDPEDIESAFKNHSTSKISELSDFDTLTTLGFRGEALPSIMEVSRIELQTSNNNEGRGIYCKMESGEVVERREIACKRGTSIAVKDLFFNFPVRQKFLKTERTELSQVVSFLETMALVSYDKSIELIHNNRTVFIYKKAESLRERIYQVFGKDFLDALQEVDFQRENYNLKGFVSKLNTGLSVKKHQYFFVNQRPVKEKTLMAALNNTFERFLERHRYPVGILMLSLPPHEVDVNIHPMKLEIKFENANAIYKFIKEGIEDAFGVFDEYSAGLRASAGTGFGPTGPTGRTGQTGLTRPTDPTGQTAQAPYTQPTHPTQTTSAARGDFEQSQLFAEGFLAEDDFSIIGQYKNSYILVEKNGDLLIVDQHNAQERVNFDQLKNEYRQDNINSITPLFPVIIDLTPSEVSRLGSKKTGLLKKMGFRLEPLGGNTYDIKSFPQILGEKNIKDAIRTIIHMDIAAEGDEAGFEDSVLAEIACKSAIKVNHKLYPDQMKTIVKNLFKTGNPYFCPHQRPIIVEFSLEQIEKLLKRK